MSIANVSEKCQVVIPADVRRALGIAPGSQVDFRVQGMRATLEVVRKAPVTRVEDGYGMITARALGKKRSVADFDVAAAMRRKR